MISEKKILISQTGKLGDMVLTTPLFYELNKHFPHSQIFVIASKINFKIPENIKFIKETLIYKKEILSDLIMLYKLRRMKFDIYIDINPEYSKTGEIFRKIINPKKSFGYNHKYKVFDVGLEDLKTGKHYTEISLSPMYHLVNEFQPEFIKPILSEKISKEFKYDIAINISSGYEIRNWDIKNWEEVINYCLKKDYKIIVIYDINHIVNINYLKHIFNTKLSYSETSIESKMDSIGQSKVLISTDTAMIHIASALNKPVIGLYTNIKWNLDRFYPLSDRKIVLVSEGEENVNGIAAEAIIERIEEFKNEGIL